MASEISYGEDFRSIGQALEAKNVRSFELKRVGDWYVLQGVPPAEGLAPIEAAQVQNAIPQRI